MSANLQAVKEISDIVSRRSLRTQTSEAARVTRVVMEETSKGITANANCSHEAFEPRQIPPSRQLSVLRLPPGSRCSQWMESSHLVH